MYEYLEFYTFCNKFYAHIDMVHIFFINQEYCNTTTLYTIVYMYNGKKHLSLPSIIMILSTYVRMYS